MCDCPYKIGDIVEYRPPPRTKGLYPFKWDEEIKEFERGKIERIKEGTYIYIEGDRGGWPWNHFVKINPTDEE